MPLSEDQLPGDDLVLLTYFRRGDAAALQEADADAEHRRRFDFPDDFVPSLEHSERVIDGWNEARNSGDPLVFAVRSRTDGKLLGGCELRLGETGVANVSYFTLPKDRGRGIASRAVALARRVAASMPAVQRLEIIVDHDNLPSRRVAASNGFHERGTRNGRVLYVFDLPDEELSGEGI